MFTAAPVTVARSRNPDSGTEIAHLLLFVSPRTCREYLNTETERQRGGWNERKEGEERIGTEGQNMREVRVDTHHDAFETQHHV